MASIVSGYLSRRVEFMLVIVLATRFVIYLSYEPSVRLDWLKVKVEDNYTLTEIFYKEQRHGST